MASDLDELIGKLNVAVFCAVGNKMRKARLREHIVPVLEEKDAEIAELRSERDALAAQVAELKKLLRPFANYANAIDKYENYENHVAIGYISGGPNVGDCRAARAALQEPSRDE